MIEYSFDGIKNIEVVIKKMQKASNHWSTGMHLSNGEVHNLLGCLMQAHNRFMDVKTVAVGSNYETESSGEEDDDEDEQ